jgi:DNA repair protein RecN (Recombination protein N)
MLATLRIRHLALVEDLEWTPGAGFIAVTGETGSGKSIILGALKLLLGERADKSLIRTGAETCTVEAIFQLGETAALDAQLEEQGIEPCAGGELILKRSFSTGGTNRQFINGSPTTLAILKTLGDSLVDLHGPHDHQSLLASETQLDLLDAFAGAGSLRAEYLGAHSHLNRLVAEHAALATSEASLEREVDLLTHQVREIEAARLDPAEEQTLHARYTTASNSRRLIELSTQILQRLAEADGAALARLSEVQRLFRELEKTDPATAHLADAQAGAIAILEETARDLQRYSESLETDPAQLAELEERITLLETLKRKYGATIQEVIHFGNEAAARLRKIESRGEELDRLTREIESARGEQLRLGEKLRAKRRTAAPGLSAQIKAQLHDLGFQKSGFSIRLDPLEKPAPSGLDAVEFLFAPNPGEPARPLKAIASSGEISRVMLAVKSALAAQDRVPLLVFDEIDANVGGEIAHAVGARMQALGRDHQVLCITHLPQVAAGAAAQFVVTKDYRDQRTVSQLTEIRGKARIEEIARMLGGKSSSALAHARTLLGGKA